jgi:hypothetical protein
MLDTITAEHFKAITDKACQIHFLADRSETCSVAEVHLLKSDPSNESSKNPFSVVFLHPGDAPYPQGIYRIQCESIGEMDLFLVPIGPGKDGGMQYEAIFT